LLVLAALAAAGGLIAFRVLHRGSGTPTAVKVARYCQLAGQLELVALTTGAASAPGVFDGSPEAVAGVAQGMGSTLDELRAVTPAPLGKAADTVVDGLQRAARGDPSRIRGHAFVESSRRLSARRATYCSTGSGGSGEG
jgi:hypothetical protein